jgi:hypothetical protein
MTTLYSLSPAITQLVNGNVGIGTRSPGAKLDVEGGELRIGDNAGSFTGFTFSGGLVQTNNNFVNLKGALQVDSTAGSNSYIVGTGNVGIGLSLIVIVFILGLLDFYVQHIKQIILVCIYFIQ